MPRMMVGLIHLHHIGIDLTTARSHHIPPTCSPSRIRHRRKSRIIQYAHASVFALDPTGSTSRETQLNRKPQFRAFIFELFIPKHLRIKSPWIRPALYRTSSLPSPTGMSTAIPKKSNPSRSSPSSSTSNFIKIPGRFFAGLVIQKPVFLFLFLRQSIADQAFYIYPYSEQPSALYLVWPAMIT